MKLLASAYLSPESCCHLENKPPSRRVSLCMCMCLSLTPLTTSFWTLLFKQMHLTFKKKCWASGTRQSCFFPWDYSLKITTLLWHMLQLCPWLHAEVNLKHLLIQQTSAGLSSSKWVGFSGFLCFCHWPCGVVLIYPPVTGLWASWRQNLCVSPLFLFLSASILP